jgi:hypothetical protein
MKCTMMVYTVFEHKHQLSPLLKIVMFKSVRVKMG